MAARPPRARQAPPEFTTIPLDRRRFLVLLGGAAAYQALRPHAAWARRVANALPAVQPWTLPQALPPNPIDAARALIGAAVLAPSYWNAQPWRFEVEGETLRLVLEPSRSLPACDPDQRFAHLSLGAALENLLIAARAWGRRPSVQYTPFADSERAGMPFVAAQVAWNGDQRPRDRLLFLAIPDRRTNGRHYDGRAITIQSRTQLMALAPDDVRLHWLDEPQAIRDIADVTRDATLARMRDRHAQAERFAWLRLSDDAARRTADGVPIDRLEMGGPARWFASHYFHPESRFFGLGAQSVAKEAREAVRSSGALVLLSVPARTPAAGVVAGQTLQRFALRATTLGIAHQPLSSPIESERHRAILAKRFGATGEEPMLLLRLGHAKPPEPTLRRGAALVSTFRNS